ncbi:MAG: response regulator [Desulfobacterales bacterium]
MMKTFNLLIADRNPHIRNFLKREMEAEGYHVKLAKNAREVLNVIYSSEPIDLSIIDLDLPGADELNLLRCLEDRIPVLPFVIHSYVSDYRETSSNFRAATIVPKQGSSSETLKDVIKDLLMKSYPKRFKTPVNP